MPFRFRKSFKVGGIRFNFGKKGLTSASLGGKGFSLNLGKRGVRPTIGIPGTGLSYTASPTKTKKKSLFSRSSTINTPQRVEPPATINRPSEPITRPRGDKKPGVKIPFIFVPVVGAIVIICGTLFVGSAMISAIFSTPTPAPTIDVVSIQNTANAEAWLPYTQTAAAAPTITLTVPPLPTETLTPLPTITLAPSFTPLPTETLLAIQKLAPLPTQPQQAGACPCSGDTLNCGDFSSHSRAQACYNYCVSVGAGDIHGLDKDGNGSACEALP